MRLSIFLTFYTAFLGSSVVRAQEQLGLRLDNYAGVSGLPLNPSAVGTFPMRFDVSILGGGGFGATNVAHVQKAGLSGLARNYDLVGLHPNLGFEAVLTNPKYYLDFQNNNRRKYALSAMRIELPSFVFNFYGGHSFGMVNSMRVFAGSSALPKAVNYYNIKDVPVGTPIDIEPFRFSAAAWTELGLNYGYRSEMDNGDDFSFGMTVKYLMPHQAAFFQNRTNTKITEVAKSVWIADTLNVEAGFTQNAQNDALKINGNGFGLDLGISYVSQPDQNGRPTWRFGFSILDLGRMTFEKNTELHRIARRTNAQFTDTLFNNISPTADYATEAARIVSQKVLGAGSQSRVSQSFDMALPTALSVQGDVHLDDVLDDNFFVSGAIVQRIGSAGAGRAVSRPNQLAVMPRWETRWLGVSMPVSLLEWQKIRFGLSARLAYLTVGTEDLGSFFYKNRLNSADFYIALKINPISEGRWGEYGGSKRGNSKVSEGCYKF